MTTPAQIEAASDAIAAHPDFDGSPLEYQSVAKAALTAAAEAGEPPTAEIEAAEHILDNAIAYATGTKVTISIKQANLIWSALVSAAQVGEPIATAEMYDNRVNEIVAARQKEIEAATIERCAQVAENCGGDEREISLGQWIAAAIRKLKDEI